MDYSLYIYYVMIEILNPHKDMRKIKNYFNALKSHPGVPTASILSAIFTFIGVQNSQSTFLPSILCSLLIWSIVLISNIGRNTED